MTQEEIKEGNKIIGEFMGKNFKDPLNYMYDKDWNWLMPVVEKIEGLGDYGIEVSLVSCHIYEISDLSLDELDDERGLFIESNENSKIEAVWAAVVEFIKWYNNEKM